MDRIIVPWPSGSRRTYAGPVSIEGVANPEDDSPFPDPVKIPITDAIDLHLFRAAEVGEVVDAYLEAAAEAGFREVRLIHGRGER